MNIIERWLAKRRLIKQNRKEFIAAARKMEQAAKEKKEADDLLLLRGKIKDVKEAMDKAGFSSLEYATHNPSVTTGHFYALDPNKQLVYVTVTIGGGMAIEYENES
jgi:hypothetical protein